MPSPRISPVGLNRRGLVLLSALFVTLVSACTPVELPAPSDGATDQGGTSGSSAPAAYGASALAALGTLAVKGRAPKTGYDRLKFGRAWADVDHNGCDTRNDVLRRDLRPYVLKWGTKGCIVLSGTLHDPYSGKTIAFAHGAATSSLVQIDHVVPLSDAWQKGAQQWTAPQRTALANDLLNLLAVDGLINQRKGDGDAATWLPPSTGYRCSYAARQIAVKAKYGLWVTSAEKEAMRRILATCPSERIPSASSR